MVEFQDCMVTTVVTSRHERVNGLYQKDGTTTDPMALAM